MRIDVVMPKLGESVTEGTVVRWLKKEGDRIGRDEPVLEITTDKIDTDVPAVAGGVLEKILVPEGETVSVGQVLGVIETEQNGAPPAAPEAAPEAAAKEAPVPAAVAPAAPVAAGAKPARGRFYSPLVRSIARQEGIDLGELERLQGSGRDGRFTKKDILAYLARRSAAPVVPPRVPPAAEPAPSLVYAPEDVEIVPMDGIRKAIAEHMVRSKRTSPHVTSFTEVDMTRIVRYREQTKEEFLRREGFKLTLTPFFISAIVDALRQNPIMNASVDGDKIILWKHIHFGIAVGLEKGVVVPVIRHAEAMNFIGIARAAYDLAVRAHDRRLSPDELQGGTFTLTNPGMFGTLFGTPIISQPQVGIIATGAVKKRVMALEDDTIAIRSMMFMSLSYDHRLVDGLNAARFTQAVTRNLEQFDFDRTGI
jgi:2-oxoglutarate dehydrogenase E2 component (dihydrolipoamide succinyltransferase)